MIRQSLSKKPAKLFVIFTLVFVVSFAMFSPFQVVAAQSPSQNQYYNTQFGWDYAGNHWVWNLSIPARLYNAYVEYPDYLRTQYALSDFGFFTTTQDPYLQTLVQKINDTTTQLGYNSLEQVNFVLAFVQSIPYKTDNESTGYQDYPRFPVETLVDNVGDCKSHSILFATLTLMLGYDAVYINPPDHLAVGILGNDLSGTYFTYNNQTYYYCETTGIGFTVGQLPDQFNGVSANVEPIDVSEQYIPNLQVQSIFEPNPAIAPDTPSPTSISGPNATPPSVTQPTIQPVQPLSLNMISDSPIFFMLIIIAIAISIVATIKTAKSSSKEPPECDEAAPQQPSTRETTNQNTEQAMENLEKETYKFCIYCGSSNKSFAAYCEKCGKNIG